MKHLELSGDELILHPPRPLTQIKLGRAALPSLVERR
jgi:hypothetical protein